MKRTDDYDDDKAIPLAIVLVLTGLGLFIIWVLLEKY
jgi:hypothetical protein